MLFYKRLPNDECFDRIDITAIDGSYISLTVIPRYKTSGLSGDEWRTSVVIRAAYGEAVWSPSAFRSMENALKALGYYWTEYCDLLSVIKQAERVKVSVSYKGFPSWSTTYKSFFEVVRVLPWGIVLAMEDPEWQTQKEREFQKLCMQPGCRATATKCYQLKHQYSGSPYMIQLPDDWAGDMKSYRVFCEEHSERGDSDLEDRDSNYIPVSEIDQVLLYNARMYADESEKNLTKAE